MVISVFQPIVLVALPFAFLALGGQERTYLTGIAGIFALVVLMGGGPEEGLWLVERGWSVLVGGGFLAVTLAWPGLRFTDRAIVAVGVAFTGAAVLMGLQPESWGVLDWLVRARILEGAGSALEALRVIRGETGLPEELVKVLYETADLQGRVFPALVGLSSLAALGVAWWTYLRLATRRGDALGPLKGFRFSNGLIWVFIAGLVLVVVGAGDGPQRAGLNALVFMGGLYALRGAAVVVAVNGGMSLFGFVLLGLGLLLLAPLILVGALIIGLGDTWIDLRSRFPSAVG